MFDPLFAACYKGHTDIVQSLLANGAKVNKRGKNGIGLLFMGCKDYIFLKEDNSDKSLTRFNGARYEYSSDVSLSSFDAANNKYNCGEYLTRFDGTSPLYAACYN